MNRLSALLSNSKQIILPALLTGLLVVLLGCPTEAPKKGDSGALSLYKPTTIIELKAAIAKEIKNQGNEADLQYIDTSQIEDMTGIFSGNTTFNGDVSKWKTGKVENMQNMFGNATKFNGDVSAWDTSSVQNMSGMFSTTNAFNGNIAKWDTRAVMDIAGMFRDAKAFDGDISTWDTRKVTDMDDMFRGASKFNQNIARNGNQWNTSNVTTMRNMFNGATVFNQNLSNWDVSKVIGGLTHDGFATDAGFDSTDKHPTWP